MAAQRQFQAPAHGRAGYRGDDRLGHGIHIGQGIGQRCLTRVVGLAEFADVGAAAEVAPATDDHECADMVIVVALPEGIENALHHAFVHRQRIDRRILEGDDTDIVVNGTRDEVGHDEQSFREGVFILARTGRRGRASAEI